MISGSRESPLESGRVCFNISIREDMYKEGEELFTLTLETNDSCVWLGRDGALLRVEENGGEDNLVRHYSTKNENNFK